MNRIGVVACVVLLCFFVSCTKKGIVQTSAVDTTNLSALVNFKVNEIDFEYFHFRSKVEYQSGEESQNFTVNGRIKKDSVIWLSITPGLGIEAMRCMIVRDSVYLLDRIHNKYFAYDFSFISSTFKADMNFENLQALLVGNLAYSKSMKDKLVKKEEMGFYLLRQLRKNIKVDNYVSTQNLKIETAEIQNVDNNSSLSLKYSEFAPLDSFLFANHIKTVVKFADAKGVEKNTIIDIQHHKAEIVTKPLNFPFNVPKKFEDK